MRILSLFTSWVSKTHQPPSAPWTNSIDAIRHLDYHMLKDIGAPDWVINEVQGQQAGAIKQLRKPLPR